MDNTKQFVCLSGLPRTGSTLLSAILSQNTNIHAEGNSAVCQLMNDMYISCETSAKEQLTANNREYTKIDLVKSIPNVYYQHILSPIIVDKCRAWTEERNQFLYKHITQTPKTIVLVRPLEEIIKSFVNLYEENNYTGNIEKKLVDVGIWHGINEAISGIKWAKKNNRGEFLFISYDELIGHPEETLKRIYEFCGWEWFDHDYNAIVNTHPENDNVYKLKGMHDVRNTISKRLLTTQITPALLKKCREIDNTIK